MGTRKLDVDELARAEDLMPKWCVLTRSRKAERACENTTSEHEFSRSSMTGVFPHTQVVVRALKTNVVRGFM